MNDFLNGWGSGMTGSGNGLPSQSVLEKMGRDAASNQWNNNNQARHSSGGSSHDRDHDNSIPVTTIIYQKSKQIRFKKLLRHFAIAAGLMILPMVLRHILPISLWGYLEILSIPGFILMLWVFIRLPFYAIGRIGSLFEKKKTEE